MKEARSRMQDRCSERLATGAYGRQPRVNVLGTLILVLLLTGCGKSHPASLTEFFPDAGTVPGWTPSGEVELYDRENIYDLVDGQAESFFAYGFEQVAVQDYEDDAGAALGVEIWQLATPADAYGLFTASIAGAPVGIGNDGDQDPGRRLIFWQDRYTVQVRARQELDAAELERFAQEVSTALPSGGERPEMVGRLPSDGLVERSALFFHEEISIQDRLWLGGENLLGLGPEVDGVLGHYDLGGTVARLLLVQYPDAGAASAGLAALEGDEIGTLAVASARDSLLGAVFGEIDKAAADMLLAEVLSDG